MTRVIRNFQDELNRCMPAAFNARLGDTLADLIAMHNALLADFTAVRATLNGSVLLSAGLVIKAGGSPTVKAGNQIVALAGGVPVTKAANTDMAALVGTLATAKSAAWAFYIDNDGVLTASAKTADAATDAAAIALLPATPADNALIGYIVVENASGSNFVGGTTALDEGDVTVTYVDVFGVPSADNNMTASEVGELGSR